MLKDIQELSSENVSVAAVHELNDEKEMVWNIYLLNYKDIPIEGVLVMSKGIGTVDGEEKHTSTLRHFLDTVPAGGYVKIEPFPEDLSGFSNQYYVTYYANQALCEKTFTFEPYSISTHKAEYIELISQDGVELTK